MASEEQRPADSSPGRTVGGVLRFGSPPPTAARLVVRVLDVSRADAPSTVVAERVSPDAPLTDGMPFEVAVPADVPPGSYILQVHVDVDRSGEVSAGDYLTAQAYPVLAGGSDRDLEVRLTGI